MADDRRPAPADTPGIERGTDLAPLVRRARQGDRAAFDELVERHLAATWRTVWRIVRGREDAEDVVQEVFLAAWRHLDGLAEPERFSGWLRRIAVTRALNHVDRAGERLRRASTPLEDDDAGRTALASPAASPLRTLEARELLHRLAVCLERLPVAWRAVLVLRENEALAYERIAATLGIAIGTVRSRLARARIALRECIAEGDRR